MNWSLEMSYRRRPTERTTNERVSAVHPSEENPNKTGDFGYRSSLSSSWPLEQEETRIWLICLVIRVINAVMVQTYFNPDEHWQSLEVAHRLSFGYNLSLSLKTSQRLPMVLFNKLEQFFTSHGTDEAHFSVPILILYISHTFKTPVATYALSSCRAPILYLLMVLPNHLLASHSTLMYQLKLSWFAIDAPPFPIALFPVNHRTGWPLMLHSLELILFHP